MKEGQYTEEVILDNNENSPLFEEFLQVLGDRVRLKGKSGKVSKTIYKLSYQKKLESNFNSMVGQL